MERNNKHPLSARPVWLVNWSPGRGTELLGKCPAVIVQTDAANSNARCPNTIEMTLSTKGLPVSTHFQIEPDLRNGLREISWVKCEQVLTISKERLEVHWGSLSETDIARIEVALKLALGMSTVWCTGRVPLR